MFEQKDCVLELSRQNCSARKGVLDFIRVEAFGRHQRDAKDCAQQQLITIALFAMRQAGQVLQARLLTYAIASG